MATQPQFVLAQNQPSSRRISRRPQQKFNLTSRPFQIVPLCIAPVLPGETLQNLLLQSRAVTDPVKNRLVGWHKEYYFFYVPLPSLGQWDANGLLQSMMLDPSVNVGPLKAGANFAPYYTFKTGMDFTYGCLQVVVNEFFRDEDETWATGAIGDYPVAQIDQQQWYNSFKLESATGDDMELPGVDQMEELDILPGFETAYAQWEIMRDSGMVDVDYDDFIRSYGVDVPKSEELFPDTPKVLVRPELIRFARSWTYPANTIDPADGSATSAVSWSIAERADKKRFFKYPGFIFGVTVTRPKIYLGNQKGAAVGYLNNAYAWLPAVLAGYSYAAVQETMDSTTDGILQNQTEDYWYDVKDLFLYGDQYINFAPDIDNAHALALPTATGGFKYPSAAMVDGLFVDALKNTIREDGVVHLNILSRMVDTTP